MSLQIYTKQAFYCFEQGNYIESAMYFAKTRTSFEEIALKFMQVEDKTALLNFLKKRLELVKCFSSFSSKIICLI